MYSVKFLNFELGYDSGHQTLVGHSGVHYGGPSKFSHAEGCQEIIATFPDEAAFKAAMKQIMLNYSLYGRRWAPVAIVDDTPIGLNLGEMAKAAGYGLEHSTRNIAEPVDFTLLPDKPLLEEVERRWPGLLVPVAETSAVQATPKRSHHKKKELVTSGAS